MHEIISLKTITNKFFLEWLYNIFPYKNYQFKIDELYFDEIIPLCKNVYSERLNYAIRLKNLYLSKNIDLFLPVMAGYDNDKYQYIAPPVVEIRGNDKVLCDGTHRLYTLLNEKPKKIIVIIVEHPYLVLPGRYNNWDNIAIQDIQLPSSSNFIDFNKNGLTGYSKLFNGKEMWIE